MCAFGLGVVLVLGLGAGAGCARTLPAGHAEAVVYRDLERVVGFNEAAGWGIDRREVEEALPDALMTICQVSPEARASLLAWVDARLLALGGPVELAWKQRGRRLAAVDELLTLTRVRLLLVAAIEAAPRDCPFWLEPHAGFAGRQIGDDRWQVELAGGGKGILGLAVFSTEPDLDITGGGAGRVVLMRHVGSRLTFGLGLELGASADFQRDAMGERSALLFAFDLVVPVVLRYRLVSSFYELELGVLGHSNEQDPEFVPGLHVGLAVGGQALRQRWFLPGVALAVSYEQTFPGDRVDTQPLHLVKIGLRVSATLDL